jgi:hypothetical protein
MVATGDPKEALPQLQRAYDDLVAALGAEHPSVFYPRLGLGRALVRLGRAAEALPILETAVASRANDDSDLLARAEAELELARALENTPRALDLARTARDHFLLAGTAGQTGVEEADAFIAEATKITR